MEATSQPVSRLDGNGFREVLEAAGHRFTPQRAAVFRALDGSCTHPTADELFTAVRQEIPDISLATVYKALETFVSAGLALKLVCGDGPARYDARTDAHHHLCCASCGLVKDVEGPSLDARLRTLAERSDFEVHDYRVLLLGTCPNCRN